MSKKIRYYEHDVQLLMAHQQMMWCPLSEMPLFISICQAIFVTVEMFDEIICDLQIWMMYLFLMHNHFNQFKRIAVAQNSYVTVQKCGFCYATSTSCN